MNTLKVIIIAIIILIFANEITAQITIDGNITDSELIPISDALVEIIDEDDTANVYSTNTNDQGYFNLSIITDLKNGSINIPNNFIVLSNYPNPFNPSTIIYYELPKSENVEITIYDILGREIRTLFNNFHKAGTYTLEWNGRNNRNSSVAAGLYLCRLKTKDQFKVHKMVLLDGGSTFASGGSNNANLYSEQRISKINTMFNFTVRVSGNAILESDFKYLTCKLDTTLNLIVPKILQSATIGPEGGTLENENFSLIVPEGAFNSKSIINLGFKKDSIFAERSISDLFILHNLPLDYNIPLEIKIKPNSQTINESYIGVGEDYLIPSSNKFRPIFRQFHAVIEEGYLVVQLPPYENMVNDLLNKYGNTDKIARDALRTYFTAQTGYDPPIETAHFRIVYPANSTEPRKDTFNDTLERAYDSVKALNLNFDQVRWPIEVFIMPFLPEDVLRICMLWPEYGSYNLILDNAKFLEYQDYYLEINAATIREFAHCILSTYDKEYFKLFGIKGVVNPEHFWFHHATASWFEQKLVPIYPLYEWFHPRDYKDEYNDIIIDNRLAPFKGLQIGAGNTVKTSLNHGGGISSLIKYLSINYRESVLLNIYNEIKNHSHPIDAINNSLADPKEVWWPNYIKQYIEGQLYDFNSLSNFELPKSPGVSEEFEINNEEDTLKTFSHIYPDLSAKIFNISPNKYSIDTINFDLKVGEGVSDNTTLLVYANDGSNFVHLGEGSNLTLTKIDNQIRNEYQNIFPVVINSSGEVPYTNFTNIKLKVKMKLKKKILFNACKVEVRVMGIFENYRTPPPPDSSPYIDTSGYIAVWQTIGKFTDYTFEGKIDPEITDRSDTTSIRLVVDDNMNIISINLQGGTPHREEKTDWGCLINNIQLTNQFGDFAFHNLFGNEVTASLNELNHYHEFIPSNTGVVRYSKMLGYFCNESSYIKVTLFKKTIH